MPTSQDWASHPADWEACVTVFVTLSMPKQTLAVASRSLGVSACH